MNDLSGQQAALFLKDTEGREHCLEEYRGSWLLLMFHRHLG